MDGIVVNPNVAYALLAVVITALVSWSALWLKRRGDPDAPYDNIDKVLWGLTVPLLVVGGVAAAIGLASASKPGGKRKGDDDLVPDKPTEPDGETQGEQVVRIIEERAEEVEDHVLNEATEDEVAARGAHLFDPGKTDG